MSYYPMPGSVPERALAYLATLPEGTMISSADLGEVIGCEPFKVSLSMEDAVFHKAVRREMRSRLVYWGAVKAWPQDAVQADPVDVREAA